jgi:hypothetical protein
MLKTIVIGTGVIATAVAGYIATRPSEFRVVRSRTVAAPPDVVHAYVNDFRTWSRWSPWETIDPAMQRELSGAPAGPGAVYAWKGNYQIGEGRMVITDSQPGRSVSIRLEFMKPLRGTHSAQFDFVPTGAGTTVTWSMSGHNGFVAKALSVVMDMDAMIGSNFERGLASLDAATADEVASGGGGRRS